MELFQTSMLNFIYRRKMKNNLIRSLSRSDGVIAIVVVLVVALWVGVLAYSLMSDKEDDVFVKEVRIVSSESDLKTLEDSVHYYEDGL